MVLDLFQNRLSKSPEISRVDSLRVKVGFKVKYCFSLIGVLTSSLAMGDRDILSTWALLVPERALAVVLLQV